MKRTIELLKKAGVIDRMQMKVTEVKPPKGTSDEEINRAIISMLQNELSRNCELADKFVDTTLDDVAEVIRKQLNIEFVEKEEFNRERNAIIHKLVDMLFGE